MFSKAKKANVILVCSALVIFTGCATRNIEQPTPSGTVPPPSSSGTPVFDSAEIVSVKTEGENRHISPQANHTHPPMEILKGTIERFRKSYNAKGKPRMAVFLNRELSDEVREWRTNERDIISTNLPQKEVRIYKDSKVVVVERTDEESARGKAGDRGVSVYSQEYIPLSTNRASSDELWMWKFEDGFLQPFLQAGARIVDRATIMRLAAAESGQQGNTYSPITVKKVEIDALKDKADIFMEILISRAPSAPHGYEFKATAKEVSTGILLANVTSLRWDYKKREDKEIVATSRGYEIRKDMTFPSVGELSRDLALDLMSSVVRTWNSRIER